MTAGYEADRSGALEYSRRSMTNIHVFARRSERFGALRGRADGLRFVL
jgi:hypothetical protein